MGRGLAWVIVVSQCVLLAPGAGLAEETVTTPDTTPAISQVRNGAAGSSADEQPGIEPMRISMEFEGASLSRVLKSFSKQTGINLITEADVGQRLVSIYLEDVTVFDALDQILKTANLTYERQPGSDIYVVKPEGEGTVRNTITRIYRLKYARVSSSVLAKAASSLSNSTPFEATLEDGGEAGGGGDDATGIDTIIRRLLTKDGDVQVDGRTNSVIITDVPSNFPYLEAALAALDVRTQQIMVDAEIIETSLAKLKDLGVEWGTGAEGDAINFFPGGVDEEGEVLSAGRQTRFPFNFLAGERAQPTGPTGFPTSTLSFNNFQGVLQALEQDTDTKILARPKVLTLDNESALIRLTSDEAVGFTTQSQATTGTSGSTPERETTGVILVVTPQINDRNYITMIIEPSVTKTVASQITAPLGQTQPRDPKTRTSRTIVRIRSGDTFVVGGLIDRTDQDVERRVPILSGIPFMGEAFKNRETNSAATELIVFVTPRILNEGPETPQVAAAGQSLWPGSQTPPEPMGDLEQETGGEKQESIEEALNRLEPAE